VRQRTPIVVRTYELDFVDRQRLAGPLSFCRGETPYTRPNRAASPRPDEDAPGLMPFSVALADGGSLLVLYRSGYLPQAIRVNEVVADWLRALEEAGEAVPHPDLAREADDA
jgi:hypothetical protein